MRRINKILIADNEEKSSLLLKRILTIEEYEVSEANNVKEVLEIIVRRPPHLVILNLFMPAMNGYEVVKNLRNNAATSHIPIIILSDKKDLKTEIESLRQGADEFITKPNSTQPLINF